MIEEIREASPMSELMLVWLLRRAEFGTEAANQGNWSVRGGFGSLNRLGLSFGSSIALL
jgi:hypothetical protein